MVHRLPPPPLAASPGTAGNQRAEDDDAAARKSKREDAPPSRGPKKAKRHRKDGQSAKDELDSALDALQESVCGAILASREDDEDSGGRGRSDAAYARLRDSSVRAHGALARYSSSLDTQAPSAAGDENDGTAGNDRPSSSPPSERARLVDVGRSLWMNIRNHPGLFADAAGDEGGSDVGAASRAAAGG
ncbi:hypothetical protein THAOC_19424, partial [Thalassiosira oceanica]